MKTVLLILCTQYIMLCAQYTLLREQYIFKLLALYIFFSLHVSSGPPYIFAIELIKNMFKKHERTSTYILFWSLTLPYHDTNSRSICSESQNVDL